MVNLIDLVFKWVTMLTFNPDSLSLELVLEQSPITEYLTTDSILVSSWMHAVRIQVK
jgi:hypothetical protein